MDIGEITGDETRLLKPQHFCLHPLLNRFSTLNLGGNILLSILPPKFKSKIGQNNPEIRQNLSYARGLLGEYTPSAQIHSF